MVGLRFRRSIRLPLGLRLNLSTKLFSRKPLEGVSVTSKVGPLSVNSRTGAPRVDLPGGFHWIGSHRRRRGNNDAV